MIIALEDKFDVDITDEDAAQIGTVRQAVDYISHAIESRH
jgi:acyl carrier protein